jgi:hypothetical protein
MTIASLDNIVALDELTSSHVEQLHELYQGEFWSRGPTLDQTRRIVAGSSLNFGFADASQRRAGRLCSSLDGWRGQGLVAWVTRGPRAA